VHSAAARLGIDDVQAAAANRIEVLLADDVLKARPLVDHPAVAILSSSNSDADRFRRAARATMSIALELRRSARQNQARCRQPEGL
jgi:cell division septum initiation protein DivIVA